MRDLHHGPRGWLLLAALASGLAVAGCNKDDDAEEAGGGDATSGGEDPGGSDGNTGLGGAVGVDDDRPGAGEDDDSWDGDGSGDGAGDGQASAGGDGADGGDGEPAPPPEPTFEDLFGDSDLARGEPLPERRAMSSDARGHFRTGLDAARNGDFEAAKAAFERALREDSRAYEAAYNLGVIADRMGDENRAMQYYRRALQILPDYERAARGLATIYIRRGSVPDALALVEPLARRYLQNLHLQALLGEVLVRADRYEDAMDAARVALERDERFVPAMITIIKASLASGRTELAESIIEQALEVDPDDAELHFLNGKLLLTQPGRLAAALESFQKAVEENPDHAEARIQLGRLYLEGGNYTKALEELEVAGRLAPMLPEVHVTLGDAYRVNRRWEQAKAAYDRALRMRGTFPAVHFNLGLLYMDAQDDFPGIDKLTALNRAQEEFTRYRNEMGPRLPRSDLSTAYLEDLARLIKREETRIARERARAERDAARAAEGGGE